MFGLFKKKDKCPKNEVEDKLDTLDENGELPWGWHYAHKEFIDKINNEYNYFLSCCSATKGQHPKEELSAVKSFLIYIEDVRKLCRSMGETYSFWCEEILIGNIDWANERASYLEDNMQTLLEEYEKKKMLQEYEANLSNETILKDIANNEGMLQKDFCKAYPYPKVISNRLYWLEKEGKIERIKSGNSYILKVK